MGVDERPVGQRVLQLHAQLVDVDVDRAVPVTELSSPDDPIEVLAADDPPWASRQRDEQLEFPDREGGRPLTGDDQAVGGTDLQVADAKHFSRACRFHEPQPLAEWAGASYRAVNRR